MKIFLDFLPIAVFFTVFKFLGIYYATGAAMAVGIIQMAFFYIKNRKIEPMLAISMVLLMVFGSLTILLHSETFIKWKPTILYWIFGMALLLSRVSGKNLLKELLKKQLQLPENIWDKLNYAWIGFFGFVGALNVYVFSSFSTANWVNFKLFGLLGCMLLFTVGQGIFLLPYLQKEEEKSPENAGV